MHGDANTQSLETVWWERRAGKRHGSLDGCGLGRYLLSYKHLFVSLDFFKGPPNYPNMNFSLYMLLIGQTRPYTVTFDVVVPTLHHGYAIREQLSDYALQICLSRKTDEYESYHTSSKSLLPLLCGYDNPDSPSHPVQLSRMLTSRGPTQVCSYLGSSPQRKSQLQHDDSRSVD